MCPLPHFPLCVCKSLPGAPSSSAALYFNLVYLPRAFPYSSHYISAGRYGRGVHLLCFAVHCRPGACPTMIRDIPTGSVFSCRSPSIDHPCLLRGYRIQTLHFLCTKQMAQIIPLLACALMLAWCILFSILFTASCDAYFYSLPFPIVSIYGGQRHAIDGAWLLRNHLLRCFWNDCAIDMMTGIQHRLNVFESG